MVAKRMSWGKVGVLVLCALVLSLLLPEVSYAQGWVNPFADATAQNEAVKVIGSLQFWFFFAVGLGLLAYGIIYFGQFAWPQLYAQMNNFVRQGIWVIAIVVIGVPLALEMAKAAMGS